MVGNIWHHQCDYRPLLLFNCSKGGLSYRSEQEEKPIKRHLEAKPCSHLCCRDNHNGFVIAPFFGLSSSAAAAFLVSKE